MEGGEGDQSQEPEVPGKTQEQEQLDAQPDAVPEREVADAQQEQLDAQSDVVPEREPADAEQGAPEPDAEPDAESVAEPQQANSDVMKPPQSSTQQPSEAMPPEPSTSDSWLPAMPELPDMSSLTLPDMSSLLDAIPKDLPAIPSIADLTGAAAPAQNGAVAAPGPDSNEGRLPLGGTEAEQEVDTLGRADQQMPVGTPILVAGCGRGECVGFERSWFGPNMHLIRFDRDARTEVAEGVPPEPQPPTGVDEADATEGDATATPPNQGVPDAADQPQKAGHEVEEKMVDQTLPSAGTPVALKEMRWTVFACEFEGFEEAIREPEAHVNVQSLPRNEEERSPGTVVETAGEPTPAADALAQMTPAQKAAAVQSLAEQPGRGDQAMAIGTPMYVAGKGRGIYSGFVRNWVGANHHTIKFRAGVDESEVLAEVTETLALRDYRWTAIEAKMAVGG
eukprot:COSAG02_NODE_1136_length_14337_cov_50.495505_1_plen_450_part_10